MEYLIAFIVWLAFIIPVCIHLSSKRKRELVAAVEFDAHRDVKEVEAGRVRAIANIAHLSLQKQGARGYGPWLSSIIVHDSPDKKVALTAVRWTIRELSGKRFDLSELAWAERELLGMGA